MPEGGLWESGKCQWLVDGWMAVAGFSNGFILVPVVSSFILASSRYKSKMCCPQDPVVDHWKYGHGFRDVLSLVALNMAVSIGIESGEIHGAPGTSDVSPRARVMASSPSFRRWTTTVWTFWTAGAAVTHGVEGNIFTGK